MTTFWNDLPPLEDISNIVCNHPFHNSGYEFDVNLYHADFVTLEQGTGFVHIAPGHGADDYILGITNNIEVFVGCSVGSIIALLYSVGFTAKEMTEIALHINFTDFKI